MTMERNSLMDATACRDERFESLKRLYPELVRDGKIDVGALKELFGEEAVDEGEMGYNLYWPGKREAKKLARKGAEGTLVPVLGDGVDEAETGNIYIEGDNLEVLRILRKSYAERVKMIYIDPPYNTGKDFIYPDNYREPVDDYLKFTGEVDEKGVSLVANPKSGGAYHRRWLGMMLPRLQLARELLAKDGVIFISIDDNEQANLKLLCDEVFGEENFVAKFDWRKKTGANDAKDIAVVTETIFLYSKNKQCSIDSKIWNRDDLSINKDRYNFEDEFVEIRGKYYYDTLDRGGLQYSDSMNFGIEAPDGGIIYPNGRNEFFNDGWIWKWSKDKIKWGLENKFLEFVKSNKSKNSKYTIKYKVYQNVDNEGHIREKSGRAYTNLITEPINQQGNEEIKALFENRVPFSNPKPLGLLRYLLKIIKPSDSLILDFFSGSATTAHACMQLNAEDGGRRQFIMVQLPVECEPSSAAAKAGFKNICEIGKERIRRAGKKILGEHPERQGTLDVGFKVYRLAKSNIKPYTPTTGSDETALELALGSMESQITPLRDGFDFQNPADIHSLLTEILLRQGFSLDSRIEKSTSVAGNTLYRIIDEKRPVMLNVCLDGSIAKETVQGIAFGENDKFVCLNSAISDELYAQLSDKGRVETL